MDWADFFERTRTAAGVESFSKLAPLLEITDGAIGHYRMGRRVPQVWVVAAALKLQGHPTPEKAAIEIMKKAALTSPERAFWKRLGTAAVAILCAIGFSGAVPGNAYAARHEAVKTPGVFQDNAYYVKPDWEWWAQLLRWWLAWKLRGSRSVTWRPMACSAA